MNVYLKYNCLLIFNFTTCTFIFVINSNQGCISEFTNRLYAKNETHSILKVVSHESWNPSNPPYWNLKHHIWKALLLHPLWTDQWMVFLHFSHFRDIFAWLPGSHYWKRVSKHKRVLTMRILDDRIELTRPMHVMKEASKHNRILTMSTFNNIVLLRRPMSGWT